MKRPIHLGILCLLSLSLVLAFSSVSLADTDVTNKVQLNKSALTYDRRALTSSLDVSLKNVSSDVLLTPIKVVVDSISDATVKITNADGVTEDGKPYFNYTTTTGQFLAGGVIPAKKWVFSNPKAARFSHTCSVSGDVPEVLELIGSQGGK